MESSFEQTVRPSTRLTSPNECELTTIGIPVEMVVPERKIGNLFLPPRHEYPQFNLGKTSKSNSFNLAHILTGVIVQDSSLECAYVA